MDAEVEELAQLLFPGGVQDTWKDSDDFSTYLTKLASSGIDVLGREGAHLREERTAIMDQTKELAYTNYKTFIHTADCSKVICNDFSKVENHLGNLSLSLPTLKSSVDGFLSTSKNLAQSRHLTSVTLSKHTQLLEILELPQLMDTCVRNGYNDEALEIVAYVKRLEKKHPDIPIISNIVIEIQSGTRLMLNQLLGQLRSPLALPQCLKTVGLLRQLDVFTEPELRLKFLQARDAWMMGVIRAIPREDAYQHITKVVEAARVYLFDIVTQYRAIFCDDDTRFNLGDPEVNEAAIFQGWIVHKVNQFLRIVEKDLDRGVGSNLEHVLAQCMYFGQSFSRIGADFRNLLIPMFLKASFNYFNKEVRAANHKFDEMLSSFSLMESSPVSTSASFLIETQDKTRPSLILMEFLPLAHYTNGLIAAFNSLRQCCPVGILQQIISTLTSSLNKVVSALVELHRLESPGFTSKEVSSFERMCVVLATALVPHVNNCLRLLMPLENISKIIDVPIIQLERENFGLVDVDEIIDPIKKFLPKKFDESDALGKIEEEVAHQVDELKHSSEENTSEIITTNKNIEDDLDEALVESISSTIQHLVTETPLIENQSPPVEMTVSVDSLPHSIEETNSGISPDPEQDNLEEVDLSNEDDDSDVTPNLHQDDSQGIDDQ